MRLWTAIVGALVMASVWAQQSLADGEVRRIDKEARKITLRHGAIPNLDMPAHTMVFQVRDPALLEGLKVGDKVKFEAQKIEGAYVLMKLDKAE